jgi:hypothetical protein
MDGAIESSFSSLVQLGLYVFTFMLLLLHQVMQSVLQQSAAVFILDGKEANTLSAS